MTLTRRAFLRSSVAAVAVAAVPVVISRDTGPQVLFAHRPDRPVRTWIYESNPGSQELARIYWRPVSPERDWIVA